MTTENPRSEYSYQERRAELKERLADDSLPPETVLAVQYDVTPPTIRKDLQAIAEEIQS